MIFLIVVLDYNLACTEESSKCREYRTKGITSRCSRKILLQICSIFICGSLCHYLCDDRQLIANELTSCIEEHEVRNLTNRILELICINFQELKGDRVLQ